MRPAAVGVALLVALTGAASVARGAPTVANDPPTEPGRLIVAIYKSEAAAGEALKSLRAVEASGVLKLDARALIVKEPNGRLKVRDKRARGTRGGQAVAAIAGLMGANIGLGVGANTTSATNYLTSNVVGMQRDAVEEMKGALAPGDSAIIIAVDERGADAATRQLEGADRSMSYALPGAVPLPEGRLPSEPIQRPQVVPY
jgi:uncharacterized membrane protein